MNLRCFYSTSNLMVMCNISHFLFFYFSKLHVIACRGLWWWWWWWWCVALTNEFSICNDISRYVSFIVIYKGYSGALNHTFDGIFWWKICNFKNYNIASNNIVLCIYIRCVQFNCWGGKSQYKTFCIPNFDWKYCPKFCGCWTTHGAIIIFYYYHNQRLLFAARPQIENLNLKYRCPA